MTDDLTEWDDARTLADLGELTARWLEGTLDWHPNVTPGSGPDNETAELVPVLARLNRLGLVTKGSQPAWLSEEGDGQRAWVSAFCTEDTVDRIRAAVHGTDLIVIASPPGDETDQAVEISIYDGIENTWGGRPDSVAHIEHFMGYQSPNALDALKAAWQIDVIDPEWGREDLLWDTLTQRWVWA